MSRTSCLTVLLVMSMAGSAFAQQPTKEPKPGAAPGVKAPAQPPAKPSDHPAKPADHPGKTADHPNNGKQSDKPGATPPGMSEADMKACMEAATPGPMHKHLTDHAGTWSGKVMMWMAAGSEPAKSECTTVITPMMQGRFTRCEVKGDMAGMGPFEGFGVYGYDNVAKKFQSTWCDSMGTGMATGTGELSADGKMMTWTCTYNCPIKKGPISMREVERFTGKDTMTMEMYGPDPATGKEYKVMEIQYTRKGAGDAPAKASR
jgi:hypothetical protein